MKADQLSKTAAFVAIKFYGLTRDERFRSLFDPSVITFYNKLVRSLPVPLSYYHYWLQYPWVRKFYIWGEELLLPGDLLHIIARKWYIQQITQQLVNDGYEQIIILGAGFDHLGYHYSQKGLSCFEIDAPQMSFLKQQFFQEYYPGQAHPDIITSHFSDDQPVPEFTSYPKIDKHSKTIVVAEGFFDYLNPDIVNQTLTQIRSYFSHKTTLVTTHFALDELPSLHRRVFKTSVRMVGEQLRLDASINIFKQILTDQGYNICQLYEAQAISENIQMHTKTMLPILKGFYILSAKS
jgi:hypothetical protein